MRYLKENIDITNLSNYKTPAKARWYYEIDSTQNLEELYEVVKWAGKEQLDVLWVGGGTNMLFAFDVYQGVVIKNSLTGWSYETDTQLLHTYGAEQIWDIAISLEKEYKQDIWHRFIGLPGSVAGAIYGNAGCFGLETENNFVSCEVLDLSSGQVSTMKKLEMQFQYRSSILKKEKKYFLISATFDLSQKIEKYHSDSDNIYFREHKQPKGNSCGSFFKNPSRDHSAGLLIEKVGLKGYRHGGAYFSELHANFLMHDGKGTFQDMLALISLAQERVEQQFGIVLENEVQIITNTDRG